MRHDAPSTRAHEHADASSTKQPGPHPRCGPNAALVTALVVVLVGRALLFGWWVSPDEAGFSLVAGGLGEGDNLYGRYWVDRPPTLIALFALGDALGGIHGLRALLGLGLLTFVVLVHAVVRRCGGTSGWALAVAASFVIAPVAGAQVANGEAFAIPFVMASVWALLRATAAPTTGPVPWGYAWAFLAGLLGMLAMTVKQNFVDGLVFAVVLLVVAAVRGERSWPVTLRLVLAGLAGAVTTCLVMVGYALTTPAGAQGLWVAAVSFRGEASEVLASGDTTSIDARRVEFLGHALQTGVIPLIIVLLVVALATARRGGAIAWATAAMLAVEVVAVVVGGNYWSHYLLGVVPGLALAVGLAARASPRGVWLGSPVRLVSVYVVAALMVTTGSQILTEDGQDPAGVVVGEWVAASGEPGDSATHLYGLAYAQAATGMDSPYRHLWSLPVRVLDPELVELRSVLTGSDAPTWVLLSFSVHAWGLDDDERVNQIFSQRYERVLDDCGMYVYKLRSAQRHLAPTPDC